MDTVLTLTKGVLAFVGMFLNASVIYITVRAGWLHTPCNILLAVYEFCLLAYDLNKLLEMRRLFTERNFTMVQCLYISAPFLSLFGISFVLMAAIAIDRLISVIFPLRYNHLNRKVYFSLVLTATLGSAASLLYLAYDDAVKASPDGQLSDSKRVSCGITSTMRRNATYFMYLALTCELLSVLIYTLLWFLMRFTLVENAASTKRIFKSLLCILLVSLLGFTPNTSYYLVANILRITNFWDPDNNMAATFVFETTNHLALIGCSANALILFFFSWEYRRAFIRYIPFLNCLAPSTGVQYPPKMSPVQLAIRQSPVAVQPAPSGGLLNQPSTSQLETLHRQRQHFGFNKRNSHPQYGNSQHQQSASEGISQQQQRRSTVFHV